MKTCTKCGVLKAFAAFSKHKGRGDGLNNICRVCKKVVAADHYLRNSEKVQAQHRAYEARDPAAKKARDAAYHAANREKHLARFAEYRKANPEYFAEYDRQYYQRHRDRMRAANRELWRRNRARYRHVHNVASNRCRARKRTARLHDFTAEDMLARFAAQGDRCVYCGAPWEQADHVKPLAKGGPHCLANLRPSCKPCNMNKRAKPPAAWFASITRTVEVLPLP